MNNQSRQQAHAELIDEILDAKTPKADKNRRTSTINSALSAFNNDNISTHRPVKKPLIDIIITFIKSLNNHKATSTITVCLGCLALISIMPSSFDKQEIQLSPENELSNEINLSSNESPPAMTLQDSDLNVETLMLEEVVVSARKQSSSDDSIHAIEPNKLENTSTNHHTMIGRLKKAESAKVQEQKLDKPNQLNRSAGSANIKEGDRIRSESSRAKLKQESSIPSISMDKDISTYTLIQNHIKSGTLPPADLVQIDELINHFDYNYPSPSSLNPPLKATIKLLQSPWSQNKKIVHVGIKGYDIKTSKKALNIIARNVQLKVQFSPKVVSDSRLIGHNSQLRKTEVANTNHINVGNINPGHTITAIYEITLIDEESDKNPIGTIELGYTLDSNKLSIPIKASMTNILSNTTPDTQFSIAVASFGLRLTNSEISSPISYKDIRDLAQAGIANDLTGQRVKFIELVNMAEQLDAT